MADPLVDLDRKTRWFRGTAVAMLVSSGVGLLHFLPWVDLQENVTWDRLAGGLKAAMVASCFSFWLLFPILYFGYIRKSAATLEYQRRMREEGKEISGR